MKNIERNSIVVAAVLASIALVILTIIDFCELNRASKSGPMNYEAPTVSAEADRSSGPQFDKAPFCSCTIGEFDLVCSNVKLGHGCGCRDNGARMKLDAGIGYCLDGRVVSEDAYKLSHDPGFQYTKCQDPRKVDGDK